MKRKLLVITLFAIFLTLLCCRSLWALAKEAKPTYADGDAYVPGQLSVVMCDGPCYFFSSGERKWQKVKRGQVIMLGDGLRTMERGYMVLTWEANNLVFVKPNSSFRVLIDSETYGNKLQLQLFSAELMVSARDSAKIMTESRFGESLITLGDCSIVADDNHQTVRAVRGNVSCQMALNGEEKLIPEGYALEFEPTGASKELYQFNISTEYDNYKRFEQWLKRFDRLYKRSSDTIAYRIDSVKINGEFLSNMQNVDGFYTIETPDKRIPKSILLQFKITPIPPPNQRFEVSINKDLAYAVREGHDDYFEVNFALPSIPEFFVTINQLDSLERRLRLFNAGFNVFNKRFAEQRAREFVKEMSNAVVKRNQLWFRKFVSKDFRDWQGNTFTDFALSTQTIMRNYRDIRFMIHPFRFEFRKGETLVHVNYRLTALNSNWKYRFESKGSDIYTLIMEEGVYKLKSKQSGMFFNRMKTTLDLRKAVLRGRVTDERTGAPIEGVKVVVVGTMHTATTDSMGEYVIYNLEPGKYNVQFSKNGYGNLTAGSVTLSASGENNVQR